MPELPEVEITLRGLQPQLHNQTIQTFVIRRPNLRWPIPTQALQQLLGLKIIKIFRRGKYLCLLTLQASIIIHLGMSGRLRVLASHVAPEKHDHIDILFNNGSLLRFTDPRRFGALLYAKGDPQQHVLLRNLGIEPLSRKFSAKFLKQQLANKLLPIKSAIMDQRIIVGVGNIYATEALFKAGIHPLRPANSLSFNQLKLLVDAIKYILHLAIEKGGSSLKDFSNSEGKPGYFTQELTVYGRAGLPCFQCQSLLQMSRISQRTTAYCPHCQK